jgi:hypothetical protein
MEMLMTFLKELVFPILFGTKIGAFILLVYIACFIIALYFHFADAAARAKAAEYGETPEERNARRAKFAMGSFFWIIVYAPFVPMLAFLLLYYGCAFCFWLIS